MKISVVTPSYNQGQFIERTLRSVADQVAPGIEIEHVVFDGGSNDNSVEILQNFKPEVQWVSKKDKGQADAINQGIKATDGEIVCYLNSDDVFYPGALAAVATFFEANPDVDVVYGMADHIGIDDEYLEQYPTEPWDMEKLKQTCFICQPALFFRRRIINSLGLFDESLHYCMDYEYWLRLGKAGISFAYLEKKLAGSRLYADNKTLGSRVKVHREINNMFKQLFGRVPDRWLSNYAHAVVEAKTNRNDAPKRFVYELILRTIFSSLYWNKGISSSMRKQLFSWL